MSSRKTNITLSGRTHDTYVRTGSCREDPSKIELNKNEVSFKGIGKKE